MSYALNNSITLLGSIALNIAALKNCTNPPINSDCTRWHNIRMLKANLERTIHPKPLEEYSRSYRWQALCKDTKLNIHLLVVKDLNRHHGRKDKSLLSQIPVTRAHVGDMSSSWLVFKVTDKHLLSAVP